MSEMILHVIQSYNTSYILHISCGNPEHDTMRVCHNCLSGLNLMTLQQGLSYVCNQCQNKSTITPMQCTHLLPQIQIY